MARNAFRPDDRGSIPILGLPGAPDKWPEEHFFCHLPGLLGRYLMVCRRCVASHAANARAKSLCRGKAVPSIYREAATVIISLAV
jgi:hypothetical protein